MAAKRVPTGGRRAKPSRPYPRPTKWFKGFVSRRQAAHFQKTPGLRKYVGGMIYDIPPVGHGKAQSKIGKLPYRVGQKGKRSKRR